MKKVIYFLTSSIASFLLAGCAQSTAINQPSEPESAAKSAEMIVVPYLCEQVVGEIEVRFFPVQAVAILNLAGESHELQGQRAASGFWYRNDQYNLRGKGRDAWLEINGQAPIDCKDVSK